MNRRTTLAAIGAGSLGALMATPTRTAAAAVASCRVTDVKTFGAMGTGDTDDTAAIQAAIDSLPDIGGVIYFPEGKYRISAPLSVPARVLLQGAHREATQLLSGSPGLSSLLEFNGERGSVADLKVQGQAGSATIGAIASAGNVHVHRCLFEDLGIGVLLEKGSQHAIDDCYFTKIGDYGIHIAGAGERVGDSYVRNCGVSKGIADTAPPDRWTGIAIALASGANAIHLQNINIAGFQTGIWIGNAGMPVAVPENVWLSDVNVDSVRHRALDLVQGRRIAATMCVFRSNSDIGVVAQAGWDGGHFTGCQFVGSHLQGLYVCDGARHIQVTGGVVSGNRSGGIHVEAGTDIQVTGTDFGSRFFGHTEQQPYGVKLITAGSGPHIVMVTGCRFWNVSDSGPDSQGVQVAGLTTGSKLLVRSNLGSPDHVV